MAASSTNAIKESDDQNNKWDQFTETTNERKYVLSTSFPVAEGRITNTYPTTGQRLQPEQEDDLSSYLTEAPTFIPLAAPCILERATRAKIISQPNINPARPFEEILVPKPNDASSGSSTKPENDGSS